VLAEEIEGHHRALGESFPLSDSFALFAQSLMYMAATGQNESMAKLIHELGANPDIPDEFGRTPLFHAV
jgi:ankyrin repeat protein